MGDWVFGCDVCQEVCPWNRARPPGGVADWLAEGPGPSLDLIELIGLDQAAFRSRFRGMAITHTKRSGLLRNALVALGNLRDPAAIPALSQKLSDTDPVLRQHAAWALGQFIESADQARRALEDAQPFEHNPTVYDEIMVALATLVRASPELRAD
jgi:epoxyqueuosine reductase